MAKIDTRSFNLNELTAIAESKTRASTIYKQYLSAADSTGDSLTEKDANIVACSIATLFLPRPDLNSYEECVQAVLRYYEIISARNVKPTISGFAQALGVNRSVFMRICETGTYENWKTHTDVLVPDEVREFFCSLRDNYVATLEGYMQANTISATAGAFLLKNNGDYKDSVEKTIITDRRTVSAETLASKYKLDLDD